MANSTNSVQVSGFRCQQPKSIRRMGVTHELDFLSPPFHGVVLGVQCSFF